MDNNHAKNCIRPFVVGRKNWLFSVSLEGVKASANLYSLVESAKANNLEPSAYLKTVFTLLPQAKTVEEVEALLPWNINKTVG
jgi:transposase